MVRACIPRIKQFQKDSLNEDKNDTFEMFSKVQEKAEEYRDNETKYFPFRRNTVPQKSITKRILDNLHKNFLLKKTLLRFFKDGQNELKTDNLRANHIIANLFVTFRFPVSLHTQLDN